MAETNHLIIAIPDEEPVCYDLKSESLTIGRSPENDIQILVREISVTHCTLTQKDGSYEISDPSSSNGTKVNGQQVRDGDIVLSQHAKLLLGETVPGYFVQMPEGEAVDIQKTIEIIEAKAEEVQTAVPVKAVPQTAPVAATPADANESGAATVMLQKGPPTPPAPGKAAPSLPKLAPPKVPGTPPAAPTPAVPGGASNPNLPTPPKPAIPQGGPGVAPPKPPIPLPGAKKPPGAPGAGDAENAGPKKPPVPQAPTPKIPPKVDLPGKE